MLTSRERKLFANAYGMIIRERRWMWRNVNKMLQDERQQHEPLGNFSITGIQHMKAELELELDLILENAVDLLDILLKSETLTGKTKLFYIIK